MRLRCRTVTRPQSAAIAQRMGRGTAYFLAAKCRSTYYLLHQSDRTESSNTQRHPTQRPAVSGCYSINGVQPLLYEMWHARQRPRGQHALDA